MNGVGQISLGEWPLSEGDPIQALVEFYRN
jgi:hypothetical protein